MHIARLNIVDFAVAHHSVTHAQVAQHGAFWAAGGARSEENITAWNLVEMEYVI